MKHILQLRVEESNNEGVLLIEDISVYTPSLPISCMTLQITPPGFSTPTVMTPASSGFDLVLNACALGIMNSTQCSDTCPGIPDGIYGLYYSVSPNDKVYVSYQYMRITSALNRLNLLRCGLNLKCCLPDKEELYNLNNIDIIRNFLRSAQTNCNDLHNYQDAINQYRYAVDLMDRMGKHKPVCNAV